MRYTGIRSEDWKTLCDNLAGLAGGDLPPWAHDLVIEMVEALEIELPTTGPIAERITDPAQVPRAFCCPDERRIAAEVSNGVRVIPGVRIYETSEVRVRT